MVQRQRNAAPPPPVAKANGADKDDEITTDDASIVVEDDGAAGTVVEGGGGAGAAAQEDEDPGVRALREQKEAAERRAAEAESALQRERSERGKDQETIRDSRLAVIEGTITTAETKRDAIKRRITEAKEAGDYAAETDAQAELAEVTLDIKQARLGKERLEREIEEGKTAKPAAATEGEDPIDTWGRNNNMGTRSIQWLKEHREYTTDPVKNAELGLAEAKARKAGHQPNTDGYFQAIEENLGMRETQQAQIRQETRRENSDGGGPAMTAPVSRSSSPMNGAGRPVSAIEGIVDLGGGKYRVSREIAEAAQIAGIPVKTYVEEALKLKRGSDGQLH